MLTTFVQVAAVVRARVVVGAGGIGRATPIDRRVRAHASARLAGVLGARLAIVAVEGRAIAADVVFTTRFDPVARVAVVAFVVRLATSGERMLARAVFFAGVGGAGIVVIAVSGRTGARAI